MSPTSTGQPLRLGTRGSALALAQAQTVADEVRRFTGRPVDLVPIRTAGDTQAEPLDVIGGTGVFTTAVREALTRGEVDLVVHSLKDLPTAPADGIALAAVPRREDPRDALCSKAGRRLAELPAGARVGTGSPRRAAQLRWRRPDLDVVGLRGNVDTRLRRLTADGDLDAVVLARAGLVRLHRLDSVTESLDADTMLPAPGQGALAVECRADATSLRDLLAELDHPASRAAVLAERALLAALEAGCTAPVGALAELSADSPAAGPEPVLHLSAAVVSIDGATAVRMSASGPAGAPQQLGESLAAALLADGAAALLGERVR
ncbi:MAG: hydroxymethylbilane synthase [Actinomycetota bacterium]|nr:MAG: hydroxymethylbilane synthase [Actinomycetota bacterium]